MGRRYAGSNVPTVGEIVKKTTDFFSSKSETARLDSELLIASALGWERLQVYLKHDSSLSEEQLEKCRALVRRRAKGEPVAYILGEKGFYKHTFEVTSATLIPRPETEMLVVRGLEILSGRAPGLTTRAKSQIQIEIAAAEAKRAEARRAEELAEAKARGLDDDEIAKLAEAASGTNSASGMNVASGDIHLESPMPGSNRMSPSSAGSAGSVTAADSRPTLTIVDLGCGTGCIGLSLASELNSRANVRLVLVDVSEAAVEVAKRNAERMGLSAIAEFVVADAGDESDLKNYFGLADLVVANPPYIDPSDDRVEAAVREFEPTSALFAGAAGERGIFEIARWSKVARRLVPPGGAALFEIGDRQGDESTKLFKEAGWDLVKLARDHSDRERMVEASSKMPLKNSTEIHHG